MGYATENYFSYGINLGDAVPSAYERGPLFASGTFKSMDPIGELEVIVKSDYPELELESAGDSTYEHIVLLVVKGTTDTEGALISAEATAQLEAFASRFHVEEVPDWFAWSHRI